MTILLANLKHLYQQWFVLLLSLLVGGASYFTILQSTGEGKNGLLSVGSMCVFFWAILLAGYPLAVLTKPFSYCLPGHRTVAARFLFVVAVFLCGVFALPVLFHSGLALSEAAYLLVPTFCTYTIFFWWGAGNVFFFYNWGTVFGLLPLALLVLQYSGLRVTFEHYVFIHAWAVVILAVLVNGLAYRFLWNNQLARRYCGELRLGLFDYWDRYKIARFRQIQLLRNEEKAAANTPLPWESAFLNCMAASEIPNLKRHVVSGLYRLYTGLFVHRRDWLRFLVVFVPVVGFLGYLGEGAHMVYLLPVLVVNNMSLGLHTSRLVSGGRRERFYTGLAVSIAITLLVMVGLSSVALISWLLGPIMPDIPYRGEIVSYYPLAMKPLLIPLSLIPLVLSCGLIFPKQLLWGRILPVLIFLMAFQCMIQLGFMQVMRSPAPLIGLVIFTVGAWMLFMRILHYSCMRRCLGSQ
ncbi:hypothetical protein ACFL6U_21370 [Planctomycetota bacterium]